MALLFEAWSIFKNLHETRILDMSSLEGKPKPV